MLCTNRVHDQCNARGFGPAKFRFLQIDVVDDLRNSSQRVVANVETIEQHFECAEISFMRKFRIEHVKAQFIRLRPIAFGSDELESRVRIDKSADEPRRGDAIDVNTLSSYPGSTGIAVRPLLCLVNWG